MIVKSVAKTAPARLIRSRRSACLKSIVGWEGSHIIDRFGPDKPPRNRLDAI